MLRRRSSVRNSRPRPAPPSSRSFSSDEMLSKKEVALLYVAVALAPLAAGMTTSASDADTEAGVPLLVLVPVAGPDAAVPLMGPWVAAVDREEGGGAGPSGEPVAVASFARSCLLNLALEEAKSKSVLGTSTAFAPNAPLLWLFRRRPAPPPPAAPSRPPRWPDDGVPGAGCR